ncbi:MAG: shikimate kinase [Inquilinus sp.]|nr:shikimate kinase [Inquilinus sp.]
MIWLWRGDHRISRNAGPIPGKPRNEAEPPVNLTLPRSLVLIGLMGAGKTAIGRRLATHLGLPFVDADDEIEQAAGLTIEDIFETYGEPAFRDVERRVIARLLGGDIQVVSTGGGAYMDMDTRALVAERGISLWLRVSLDLLVARTGRRGNRPLLKRGNRREILDGLMQQRYPVYARADITVDSRDGPPDETVEAALAALAGYLDHQNDDADGR